MINKVKQAFLSKYGKEPILVSAPGRFNLIGEHTDYNQGFVMPGAIDRHMILALQKESGSQVDIHALDMEDEVKFSLAEDSISVNQGWAKYFQAIMMLLTERGYPVEGVSCTFSSDIPIGSGLSSSAALCCGFVYGISELFDLSLRRTEIALIAQAAEHKIGLNCGLMDQYAVLFGKKDQVVLLDCQSLQIQYIPLRLEDHSLALINTNVSHDLAAESGYNDRRASCERVVQFIRESGNEVSSLRDISPELLKKYASDLPPTDVQRARYVLEENLRVKAMVRALQDNNLVMAGELLYESHYGLSRHYEVSCRELDLLVELTRNEPGVLGARMVGGGFGGCTINLIKNDALEEVLDRMTTSYQEKTGLDAEVISFQIGEGVKLMED